MHRTDTVRSRGRSSLREFQGGSDGHVIPRPMTRRRISPGRAYNTWIRGNYKMIGYVDHPLSEEQFELLVSHPFISHAKVTSSSWIKATTYCSYRGDEHGKLAKPKCNVPSLLIIWTESKGMCYANVPSYEVGKLHGFSMIEEVREMTSEELVDTLKRSLK